MRGSKVTVLGLAILLALPLASATWFTRGTYEPDTLCDTSAGCTTPGGVPVAGGYMYQDSDTDEEGLKIYFNGYFMSGSNAFIANPNNEITGSRIVTSKSFEAYFGIWKDCDGDGYIGSASGALHTYKTDAVAIDTAICPDGSIFNRNTWVYEFIWIGAGGQRVGDQNYPSADDQRWINDTGAKAWIDFGLPGTAAGPTCPIQPWPSGTLGSTGGLLMFSDCFTAHRIAGAVNSLDPDGTLGLRFEDPNNPQTSRSLLNQDFIIHPWNDPYGGPNNDENDTGALDENSQRDWNDADQNDEDTAFHVWDCSQPEAFVVPAPVNEDPTEGEVRGDGTLFGEEGNVVEIAQPAPGVDDPVGGSYYDSVNHTERGLLNAESGGGTGLLSYTGPLGRGEGAQTSQNCDRQQTTLGQDQVCGEAAADSPNPRHFTTTWCLIGIENFGTAGTEDEFLASGFAARRESSDVFSFSLGGGPPRGEMINNIPVTDPRDDEVTLFAINPDDEMQNRTGTYTGDIANDTLGQGYQYGPDVWSAVILRPGWSAQISWTRANCCVLINTDTLQPHSAQWQTFYAAIGATTKATGAKTPKDNAESVYGDEWCHGQNSGESTNPPGLDCDATHWWNPEFGATEMFVAANGQDLGAKVGDPYHLRDIDCYDGTIVRGVPVRASLVDISAEGPCQDAP